MSRHSKSNKMRTNKSQIRSALRQLFLRSKERSEALKRDQYTCQCCGVKQSKKKGHEVKVEVHHKNGIVIWDQVIELISNQILCDPIELETLCKECHKKETYKKN